MHFTTIICRVKGVEVRRVCVRSQPGASPVQPAYAACSLTAEVTSVLLRAHPRPCSQHLGKTAIERLWKCPAHPSVARRQHLWAGGSLSCCGPESAPASRAEVAVPASSAELAAHRGATGAPHPLQGILPSQECNSISDPCPGVCSWGLLLGSVLQHRFLGCCGAG